jgi:hypothetical protein
VKDVAKPVRQRRPASESELTEAMLAGGTISRLLAAMRHNLE